MNNINMKKFLSTIFLLMVVAMLFCGCDYYGTSNNHPYLKKAELLEGNSRHLEAISWYKKYLTTKPKESEIHLKIAMIYDEQLNDYLSAIYHYKEYLTMNAEASNVNIVKSWLKLCEENYLKSQNVNVAQFTQPKSEVLTPEVEKQQTVATPEVKPELPKEADVTKIEEVENKKELVVAPPKKIEKQAEEQVEKPKVHIVERGDTLGHLSLKYYGSINYYKSLMKYNKLRSANLNIGQKILIPNLKEFKK